MAKTNETDQATETVAEVLGGTVMIADRANDEQLRAVDSFEAALKLAVEVHGELIDADKDLGNGFHVLEDKARLIDVGFVILDFRINAGDFGGFVSATVVSQQGEKWIVNDGSTGIRDQLVSLWNETGRSGGIFVRQGLRSSDYATCLECGKPRKAGDVCDKCGDMSDARGKGTTFYLAY